MKTNIQMNPNVSYHISCNESRFMGYQSKNKKNGIITLFIKKIWENSNNDFDTFVREITYIQILERICLERAFQRIRIKNRCKPICKMEKYATYMIKN